MTVSTVGSGGCLPLVGAQVDIWHCDGSGVYSDVDDPEFNTVGRNGLGSLMSWGNLLLCECRFQSGFFVSIL
jgi:hypothetical protein